LVSYIKEPYFAASNFDGLEKANICAIADKQVEIR